jgi:hypothetical protein
MSQTTVQTPADFLAHIAAPDLNEFSADPLDVRRAFHSCSAMLSLRDWATAHAGKTWTHNGTQKPAITTPGAFHDQIEQVNVEFNIVADLANAPKHMILTRGRTELFGGANTSVIASGGALRSSPLGAEPLGGSSDYLAVRIGSTDHDVLLCVQSVYWMWVGLFAENNW